MKKEAAAPICCILLLWGAVGCGVERVGTSGVNPGAVGEPASVSGSILAPRTEPEEPSRNLEVPDNDWEFDIPDNHGVNSTILAALHDALGEDTVHAVVTVKDGYIIDEYYSKEYNADSVFLLASCSKSFSGALIGLVIAEGLIDGGT